MYKLFLTWRYLTRRPLSLVAVAALSLSVAVLVVAPSIMNGFQTEFHARVRGTLSDLMLYSKKPFGLPEDEGIEQALAEVPHVRAVAPYMVNPALDKHFDKIDYCFIRGVVPEKEEKVSKFRDYFVSPREAFKEVLNYERADAKQQAAIDDLAAQYPDEVDFEQLYQRLAEGHESNPELPTVAVGIYYLINYDLMIGDTVRLTTANDNREVVEDQDFVIVGAFRTGFSENDRRHLVMLLDTMQEFLETGDRVTGFSMAMDDYAFADVAREEMRSMVKKGTLRLPDASYYLETWEEQNKTLLQAVAMERLLIRLITFLIVVAATASIFLVLFMAVHTKVRELGVLRAVGATSTGVLRLFVGQGLVIALVGMFAGLLLGIAFTTYINEIADLIHLYTGWHPFPPEVYYLDRIPSRIDPWENVVNFVVTLALGSVAALVPGLLAALRPPIKAIRHD